jgi:hypothetical protein
MFAVLGNGGCVVCGITDRRCLQFDHIFGGGGKQQKQMGGSSYNVLKYYINNPDIAMKEIQILCANHNWIKRADNNENPTGSTKYRGATNPLKQKVFDILGNACTICGFNDKRALQFDHINGDGYLERKKLRSGMGLWRSFIRDPKIKERIQVLCCNHNWIKRYENNEHPNQGCGKP